MKKRGQVTLFMIIGIAILLIFGIYFYISKNSAKSKSNDAIGQPIGQEDTNIVTAYVEACIKDAGEDAIFNRLGLQAGYIDPDGNSLYGEAGVPDASKPAAIFDGKKVPYYFKHPSIFIPTPGQINEKMKNYFLAEFENCFNRNDFGALGIVIEKIGESDVEIGLNQEDVSLRLNYPLKMAVQDSEASLTDFAVVLPIRFNALYESSLKIINNAAAVYPQQYDISADCPQYDKNGLTNVYYKALGNKNGIIQIVDFSTYENNYLKSFIFQFGVEGLDIDGACAG
jgi:hypothetical protein